MVLAYTMRPSVFNKKQRYDKSYFGWVKFEVDTISAEAIKKAIEGMDEIFRSLLIITVRENTMAPKKLFTPIKKRTNRKDGEKGDMDVELVDKEIDALVDDELESGTEAESIAESNTEAESITETEVSTDIDTNLEEETN